jgi:hypothetical protein
MRHFTVVRRLDGCSFPLGWESQCKEENAKPVAKRNNGLVLSSQESERGLLSFLLARLQQARTIAFLWGRGSWRRMKCGNRCVCVCV